MRYSKRVASDRLFDKKWSFPEGCMNTNNCGFGGFGSFDGIGAETGAAREQAGRMLRETWRTPGVATMPDLR
jgi:hypothetical protein